jgi:hypothetical protein
LIESFTSYFNENIAPLVANFKVVELIKEITKREDFIKKAKAYEDIKSYTPEKVRAIYKQVIPLVSAENKIAPIGIRDHVINFRFLYMQDIINEQSKLIKQL